jgi:hypothetical protein
MTIFLLLFCGGYLWIDSCWVCCVGARGGGGGILTLQGYYLESSRFDNSYEKIRECITSIKSKIFWEFFKGTKMLDLKYY